MLNRELRFTASSSAGEVSALLRQPSDARAFLVLAHGAGAGMRHAFLESIATALAERDVATLRYQFPYVEKGSRRPDPRPLLLATVRAAVDLARSLAGPLPIFAGGKSMGGRMTSNAAAESPLTDVRGIAFLGFPLHPPNRPGTERAEHLVRVRLPMLFVQGTRDDLADLNRLRPIVSELGDAATLHVIDDADHSFHVRKRVTGKSDGDVLAEAAVTIAGWTERVQESGPEAPPRSSIVA